MNKLYCGNNIDVLKTIPDDSINMVLTSPPYDSIRTFKGFPVIDRAYRIALGHELMRIAKEGSVFLLNVQDQTTNRKKSGTSFRWAIEMMDECGWNLFETCIYARQGSPGGWWNKRFRVDHEYLMLFFKGKEPSYFNKTHMKVPTKNAGKLITVGGNRKSDGSIRAIKKSFMCKETQCPGTILKYKKSSREGNNLKITHPGTFPDKLASDFIRCFTQENEVVLDPFLGSGTTCVVAKQLGRKYIGIDCCQEYIDLAQKRIDIETVDCFTATD